MLNGQWRFYRVGLGHGGHSPEFGLLPTLSPDSDTVSMPQLHGMTGRCGHIAA